MDRVRGGKPLRRVGEHERLNIEHRHLRSLRYRFLWLVSWPLTIAMP
jgi:hypothetical protein